MTVSQHARRRFRERFPHLVGSLSDAKVDRVLMRALRRGHWARSSDGSKICRATVSRNGNTARVRLIVRAGVVVTVTGQRLGGRA